MEKRSNTKTFQLKSNFNCVIPRLPLLSEYITSINIPTTSLSAAEMPTPFHSLPIPGDTIQYGNLNINFLLSEGASNWYDLYTWMSTVSNAFKLGGYKAWVKDHDDLVSNCLLTINNSNNIPVMKIVYNKIWPTSITEFSFETGNAGSEPITMTAVFNYNNYDIEILNK